MPSKPFQITDSLSTEDINSANPNLIARILASSRINKKHIFDFILGLLEEQLIMDDPELRTIKKEKIELIRKLLNSVLNLTEDDPPDGYKVPALQEIITEEPNPARDKMPPDYTEINPGKKKKEERYIN